MKVEIEMTLGVVNFKDKVTGEAKSMDKIVIKVPSCKELEVTPSRFNSRAVEDIVDLLKKQGGENA